MTLDERVAVEHLLLRVAKVAILAALDDPGELESADGVRDILAIEKLAFTLADANAKLFGWGTP